VNNVNAEASFPIRLELVSFKSGEALLLGRLFVAAGIEPRPTILLLHGFPGTELNLDIAHALGRAGYNVLVFHYRGAWGSGGSFSFSNTLEDAQAALTFLTNPVNSERYHIDTERLIPIGHSLGGFIALMLAAANPQVPAVASIAGFNFGEFTRQVLQNLQNQLDLAEMWQEAVLPLRDTSGQKLVVETLQQAENWQLVNYLDELANRKVLLVAAKQDEVAVPAVHHWPLVENWVSHNKLEHHIFNTNHGFTNHRLTLTRLLLEWLTQVL
jgi:uncharacterized protein